MLINNKSLINKLCVLADKNPEGFTVAIKNGNIEKCKAKKGYVVSYKTLIIIKQGEIFINESVKIPFNTHIGGWKDKDTGMYFIELNMIFQGKKLAINRAKFFLQKAIWDIKNNKEIYINETE